MAEKQKHMVSPRHVLVGNGVLDRLGEVIADLELEPDGIVVVDPLTRRLVGDRVLESLAAPGLAAPVYESSGPTMKSVQAAVKAGRKVGAHWYIGAGGGSVIDVAKLAAFEHGPAFISVPTSASHDGISSGRASIKETQRPGSMEAN